jgi:hypothetical protein
MDHCRRWPQVFSHARLERRLDSAFQEVQQKTIRGLRSFLDKKVTGVDRSTIASSRRQPTDM